MRRENFSIYVAGAVTILVLAASHGFACSCPYVWESLAAELRWRKEKFDAIFSGEVLSVTDQGRYATVEISVIDLWKGELGDKVAILTSRNNSCALYLESGKKYLVYALNTTRYTDAVSNLLSEDCFGTGLLSKSTAYVELLGEPKKVFKKSAEPKPQGPEDNTGRHEWRNTYSLPFDSFPGKHTNNLHASLFRSCY